VEKWKAYGQSLRTTFSYSTVGLEMALSVGLGYLVGDYLDGRLGTTPYGMIGMVLLGSAAGFFSLFRSLKRLERRDDD
jgi:F0F1-type ATP synthase assembly protein I